MQLFDRAGFESGQWAGSLASLLRSRHIIAGRQPKARLYRHTWTHWIQIEPAGFSGPAHWLAPEWHWHAFRGCLRDPKRRKEIDTVMQEVNPRLRQASAFCGNKKFEPSYGGEATLVDLDEFATTCPPNEWINTYLGARFDIEECLELQEHIVEKLVGPLLRGRELEAIVLEAREELLTT